MAVQSIGLWGDSIGKGVIYDEARGRYAVLKDSCVNILARFLNCRIENHAVMGATASQGVARMNDAFLHEGGIAVIEFGGNDCDMQWNQISENPHGEHKPKATVEEFTQSMLTLIDCVRAGGMKPVLVTPPPLHARRYFDWVSRGLNAEAILEYLGDVEFIYRWQERYAAAVRDVAARTKSRLLDLRAAFLEVHCIGDYYCIDGIHPNAKGHQLLAQEAQRQLNTAM